MSRVGAPITPNPGNRAVDRLRTVSMQEAVGYPAIECAHEVLDEHALILKHDRLFLLVNSHGDIAPAGVCSLGLFHDDTRILSHYHLAVCGGPPVLLSAEAPSAYGAQIDLAVKDIPFGGNPWDPKNVIHIRRELVLADRLAERLTLTSYLGSPLDYWMEVTFGCDFADIFEVRGWKRAGRGEYFAPQYRGNEVIFSYRGRDGRVVQSVVRFRDPPDRLAGTTARWDLQLRGERQVELEWEVHAEDADRRLAFPVRGVDQCRAGLIQSYDAWTGECSRWATDVDDFDHLLRRATADLRALYVEVDGDAVISAGIPWYSTIFGRDSVITSLQALPLHPGIAVDTLRYLAGRQGQRVDVYTEEQPGKILHELRRGEMARSGEIPHVPYYGSIDATPLWLILLHETWRWTGDAELVRALLPHADAALGWIDRYGDVDGDGFVEYARTSEKGLVNQGWKDSGDGVPFPDGRLPEAPIALVEVQGYVHDAKIRMAELYQSMGQPERAAVLRREAGELRERIRSAFWLEELGTFALALDGRKRPIPTATTNAGHLLWSRVPSSEEAARLAARFMAPDFFSGWGIRTLSALHPVFNPLSYHNGSVWPHDNAILVLGMALHGHARSALPVVSALYQAGVHTDFQRLPELYCGTPRRIGAGPVGYPVSCSPQAWASGSLFMLLQALLGIYAEAPARILHIRDPVLPDFLNEATVTGLAVGGSRVALQFRRHGSRTLANLLGVEGDPLQVRIELS
ncbi:MAG TPA: glycogen debranching N-terminal domain-containing protein [Gemmatimonadales bacterium]|jgi:glycogen debranching enzyme|nr:glycogen debranching N-terminal domain-containing protein [Gemmatimonadales bacterium]